MSQDEIVDIVDEQDKTLYQASKFEARQKGLLHRTVISEVKDSQGRWMFVKQSSDRQDAGQYVSPVGGHVQAGESNEDALKREALEEIGVKDFDFKFIGKIIYSREVLGRKENHYFILYELFTDGKPMIGPEMDDFIYLTDDELKSELKNHPEKFGAPMHLLFKEFYRALLS